MPPVVKICGIQDPSLAAWSFAAGADYVGLMMAPSRRQISIQQAKAIVDEVPGQYVAVVWQPNPAELDVILSQLEVVAVQHHGESRFDWVEKTHAAHRLAIATDLDPQADIVLLDGVEPGSGQTRAWERPLWHRPLWLAGGLNPHNVGTVVRDLRPDGVDVSSGVERGGIKDRDLIKQFIREAKQWPR